jgi:GTP pyrophosphokinase
LATHERLAATLPDSDAARTCLARGEAIAGIVEPLGVDADIVLAAQLFPLLEAGCLTDEQAIALTNANTTHLARDCVKLKQFEISVDAGAGHAPDQVRSPTQAEALRKMLLAIASDARLVFIRLADELHQLRQAKTWPEPQRKRLANETREIFAPLANRLGIWQLKWELEDLSFRYLDPEAYKRIAGWLRTKRADRERYITEVKAELRAALDKAGVHAEIAGRPKHIYSIWRKMQKKHLSFEQIYDIRAVRIMVDSLADCYAALGVVHGLWPFIPGEFDDYIATPKDNLYRSLHTAVIGPNKLPLEVQIRTREMHEHAELGVAAHWKYKEGGRGDPAYEQKIAWLRQVLEPADADSPNAESETDFLERMRAELFEDRVYALSPRGEVVDLPKGATPLDYAYHVHTNLGHRCRGAKVNGDIVPLTYALQNGDQVEIITTKQPHPSRDWLSPASGYLVSQRSRAKVRSWFRKQDQGQNIVQGKHIFERELQRLAAHDVTLPELLTELKVDTADQLYQALGEGDMTSAQITNAVQRLMRANVQPPPDVSSTPITEIQTTTGLNINGVGDLLSTFARCCHPVPPEAIVGYITLGRGVSIHRGQCANFRRMQLKHPERVIAVDWGTHSQQTFSVDIQLRAQDRRGLMRDLTAVVADAKLNIQSMNTQTHSDGISDIRLRIVVHHLDELGGVMQRLKSVSGVLSARRW